MEMQTLITSSTAPGIPSEKLSLNQTNSVYHGSEPLRVTINIHSNIRFVPLFSDIPLSTGEAAKVLVAPTLTSLTWRVDIILSWSSVTRLMQPFIILRIGLSDDFFRTIELSMKALHTLHKLESNYLFSLRIL
jgi:hypothetical protein